MLDLRDLRYAWPGSTGDCLALDGLALEAGRTLFVHGPSGSGKSTLLALMAGVLLPRAGSVCLQGQDWSRLSAGARDARRADLVGVIFQQFNLLPYLSVLDNVLLPARLCAARGRRCEPAPAQAAQALLGRMGLPAPLWSRRADALSVGQQQRVAVARALAARPALVLADEPTASLDPANTAAAMDLIQAACREDGAALLCTSHDPALRERFARIESVDTFVHPAEGAAR